MELLLGAGSREWHPFLRPSIDLRAVSALVLGDLGATLQVLRLAGCEYDQAEERPRSIEHCLANLNIETWFAAICTPPVERNGNYAVVARLWEHSRAIAHYSRVIASSMPGVSPDEAYLCGMLHDIGRLPGVLAWKVTNTDLSDAAAVGGTLAREWSLPHFAIMAIEGQSGIEAHHESSHEDSGQQSHWAGILQAAHELAESARVDFGEGGMNFAEASGISLCPVEASAGWLSAQRANRLRKMN